MPPFIEHPRGGRANVEWVCHQVRYGLHPSEIKLGMRIAICEHAMRAFPRDRIPSNSRFILGRVESLTEPDLDNLSDAPTNPLMTIRFDEPLYPNDPEDIGVAMQCAVNVYARYCIRVPETATPEPPREPGPTAWERLDNDPFAEPYPTTGTAQHTAPILTPEQKAAYKAKFEAEEAKRKELTQAITQAMQDLLAFEQSIYPCEHGKTVEQDCFECDTIYRQAMGLPPLADDPDPEHHVSPIG